MSIQASLKKVAARLRKAKNEAKVRAKAGNVEALEPRYVLSGGLGIGNGLDKTKVKFIDADGDKVTVKLTAGVDKHGDKLPVTGRFDIALDGGVANKSDIESIVLEGTKENEFLKIKVKNAKFNQSVVEKLINEDGTVTEVVKKYKLFTPGFTEVTSIESLASLRGIQARSAVIDSIEVTGSVGAGKKSGGISIDLSKAALRGDEFYSKVDFGSITVTGELHSLILRGRAEGGNDLLGPISAGSLGSLDASQSDLIGPITVIGSAERITLDDVRGNITVGGSLGILRAEDLFAGVSVTEGITAVTIQDDLTGTVKGASLGSLSVAGDFSGLVQTTGSIGNTVVNAGSFTGTLHSISGNVGNVLVARSTAAFSGHVVAGGGSVGNLTAGYFYGAAVEAANGIGTIKSNLTEATVDDGIYNSVFDAGLGGIAGVQSVASIADSQFHAAGAIGNIDVLQGGIYDSVFDPTSIGNVTANQDIAGSKFIASGSIGHILSKSGSIGGVTFTGSEYGFVASDDAVVVVGGSVGNVTALESILGTTVTATSGAVGNIAAQTGAIVVSTVTGQTGIGNVSANLAAFDDYASYYDLIGAIDQSVFTAVTGSIGTVTAVASAQFGGGIADSAFNARAGAIGNVSATSASVRGYSAIDDSVFTAGTRIGTIQALTTSEAGGAAIYDSEFVVIGAGNAGQTAIGPVTATSANGSGIVYGLFEAATGDIGNVTANAGTGHGIYESTIIAATGNVGVVTGVSIESGEGLYSVQIEAGAGIAGTGRIAGIVGQSLDGDGIYGVLATSGTGGIGSILGVSTGTELLSFGGGIDESEFFTLGTIDSVTGTSASGDGIGDSAFSADGDIGSITGRTSGVSSSSSGIAYSIFRAGGDIGDIAASTAVFGNNVAAIRGGWSEFETGVSVGDCFVGGIPVVGNHSTVFSALGNIGDVTVSRGDIIGAAFMAGYDIGSDMEFNGMGGLQDFAAVAPVTLGDVTVSQGDILDTAIVAGVVTSDSYLGNTDDFVGAGGTIGDVTAAGNGLVAGSVIEAGSIGDLTAGRMERVNVQAFAGDLGDITLVASNPSADTLSQAAFRASGDIGNITVRNTAASGYDAIDDALFYAGGDIGDISAITDGGATGDADAIDDSCFIAAGNIGDIYASVASGASYADSAIVDSDFMADYDHDAAGSIGDITAKTTSVDNGSGIENSYFAAGSSIGDIYASTTAKGSNYQSIAAIYDASFNANAGDFATPGGTGSIGDVTAVHSATQAFGSHYAIEGVGFYAGTDPAGTGTIGNITATVDVSGSGSLLAGGIVYSDIVAGGSKGTIGAITATGTATSQTGDLEAYGFDDVYIGAGFAYGGVGVVGAITGTATASVVDGFALAYGISYIGVYSGFSDGAIGDITGAGTATVSGGTGTVSAFTYGIYNSTFAAGFYASTGVIGDVTGTATSSAAGVFARAGAYGISKTEIFAGAYDGGGVTGDFGSGTVGDVTGTGTATATGYDAEAEAGGITRTSVIAADGDYGVGAIGEVTGYATATATADDDGRATALGLELIQIYAGVGFAGTGSVDGLLGVATAVVTTPGDASDVGDAYAGGIVSATVYSGYYYGTASPGTGTIGDITGTATVRAATGDANVFGYGINDSTFIAGMKSGVIGDVTGSVGTYATGYYGDADALGSGIDGTLIGAGVGVQGYGVIGDVRGTSNANSVATGPGVYAETRAYGIEDTTITAGSNTNADVAIAGVGVVSSIYGSAEAVSTANGIDSDASSNAAGLDDVSVDLGVADSANGPAYGGTGTVTYGITGRGSATANANGKLGDGFASAYGIHGLDVAVGDAFGYGIAKAGTGFIGGITADADATVNAQNNATVYVNGMETVSLSVANAYASGYSGIAFGGTGTVASISQTEDATAIAGAPYGVAIAQASPITALSIAAGNATAAYAYAGNGYVAKGGSIYAKADSYAKGYDATAKAYGLDVLYVKLGVASGYGSGEKYDNLAQVAEGGYGYIGNVQGIAEADAIGNKSVGDSTANAIAYGVRDSSFLAGNAYAFDLSIGGKGIIAGFNGYADAYATADGALLGTANALAKGLSAIAAKGGFSYAQGDSYTNTGKAKPGEAEIGCISGINGTAKADAYSNGAFGSYAYAITYGVSAFNASAADSTSKYGYAKAGIGEICCVEGYADATAYAVGGGDPKATAIGRAVNGFGLSAANGYSKYGPEAIGGTGTIEGVVGDGYANAKAFGDIVYAYATGTGITSGTVYAANASAEYGIATAGTAEIGLDCGFDGTGTAISSAISNVADQPAVAKSYTRGIASVTVEGASAYGYQEATAGKSTIGDFTGDATSTAYAKADIMDAYANARGITYVDVTGSDAYATATKGTAVAGDSTIGSFTGTGTADAEAVGAAGDAYAFGAGIKDTEVIASQATGAYASAGTGIIGAIAGVGSASAVAPTNASAKSYGVDPSYFAAGRAYGVYSASVVSGSVGQVTGSASADAAAETADAFAYGVFEVDVTAGSAYASGAKASASVGAGTFAGMVGSAVATVTSTKSADAVNGVAAGIDTVDVYVGVADAYYATVGTATSGDVRGTASATVTGVTEGDYQDVAGDAYGINDVSFEVGVAEGSYAAKGTATVTSGVFGNVYGKAALVLNGTTKGYQSEVYGSDVYGVDDLRVEVGYAQGYTASVGSGAFGDLTGIASSVVTGTTEGDYAQVEAAVGGLEDVYVEVAVARGSDGSNGVATAGPGTFGNISGTGSASLYGSASGRYGDIELDFAYGADNVELDVSYATAYTATAGKATIGSVSGNASAKVDGTTSGYRGEVYSSDVYGIDQLDIKGGVARALSYIPSVYVGASKSVAVAGAATFGSFDVTASSSVKGTTTGDYAEVYAEDVYGAQRVNIELGVAHGYTSTGAAAKMGNITASATVSVTGSTKGEYADVYTDDVYGIEDFEVDLGNAYAGSFSGTYYAKSVAKAGTGEIGATTASASVTVDGTVEGPGARVYSSETYGISSTNFDLGVARGYTATAGAATVGAISGTLNVTVEGTTSGYSAEVLAEEGYGIEDLDIEAGTAIGDYYAKASVATGAAAVIGAVTGSATVNVTGTTSGEYSEVQIDEIYGIHDSDINGGRAFAATAVAASGTVGDITGTVVVTLDGTVTGKGSDIYAKDIYGLDDFDFNLGEAKGSIAATGAAGSLGTIAGKATVTVTADGSGGSNFIYVDGVYGIDEMDVDAGLAYSRYGTSKAGAGTVASVSGSAYVTLGATTTIPAKGLAEDVNATDIYGIDDARFDLGLAEGIRYAGSSVAVGAAGTLGAVTGFASAKVSVTGAAIDSDVEAYGIDFLQVRAGYAEAYTATAGAGSIAAGAKVSGTGYAKADAPGATGTVDVEVVGIDNTTLEAGVAQSNEFTKGSKAFAANGTIGDIYGKADAIAVADSTTSGKADAAAYGIRSSDSYAAVAYGYDAYGATGVIGAITGKAVATATGFSAVATSKGIDPSEFHAGDAYTNYVDTAVAGTGTIGDVTGTAVATATATDGTATANADGIYEVLLSAGSAFGPGTKGGTGTIGNITGIATATGTSAKGTDSASADGIYDLDVYAGFTQDGSDFGSTSSKVGNVTGSGTANDGDTDARAYGIRSASLYSAGSIGNLDGDAVGTSGAGDGIQGLVGTARTSVGNVEGTANDDNGLELVDVYALTTIGNITGAGTRTSGGLGDGIVDSSFTAGSGIGNIVGTTADTGSNSFGIFSSDFRAGTGSIGTITASTAEANGDGVDNSVFSAVGNIGAISVTGGVEGSRFLAGIDIGTNLSLSVTEANAAVAATIGAVTVSGSFDNSDLIAGVNAGAGSTTWGNADDAAVAGGSIGAVVIGAGVLTGANNVLNNGILADTIASVTVAGNPVADPENNSMDNDVRIFQF